MLINFNILSANRFAVTSAQFKQNTQLLYEMKKDLDSIFKRIRLVKQKLSKAYPQAFKETRASSALLEDEEEDEGVTVVTEQGPSNSEHKTTERSSKSLEDVRATDSDSSPVTTATVKSKQKITVKTDESADKDTKEEPPLVQLETGNSEAESK